MIGDAVRGAAILMLLAGPLGAQDAPAEPTLTDQAWLAGCWVADTGTGDVLEIWSAPAAGFMIGGARVLHGGRVASWEHLRLTALPDGALRYTALPSDQSETHFTGATRDSTGFVVENPDHDFPQRIRYTRTGEARFEAWVEAADTVGQWNGFRLRFARVPCAVWPQQQ